MSKRKPLPTAARLHTLFAYDALTGVITSRATDTPVLASRQLLSGDIKRSRSRIRIDERQYDLLQIAAILARGDAAANMHVKPLDGNCLNTADANLGCTKIQRDPTDTGSDTRGVNWDASRGQYRITVTIDGETRYIGMHPDEETARAIRRRFVWILRKLPMNKAVMDFIMQHMTPSAIAQLNAEEEAARQARTEAVKANAYADPATAQQIRSDYETANPQHSAD